MRQIQFAVAWFRQEFAVLVNFSFLGRGFLSYGLEPPKTLIVKLSLLRLF